MLIGQNRNRHETSMEAAAATGAAPATEVAPPAPDAATTTATNPAKIDINPVATPVEKCKNDGGNEPESEKEDFVNYARQLDRPWLQDSPNGWSRLGFVKHPENWDRLCKQLTALPTTSILRLPGNISRKDFIARCERLNIPCILDGCMKNWTAFTQWSWDALKKRFSDVCWRISDTHDATLSMNEIDAYCASTQDDSPIAIYDSQFHEPPTNVLLQEYNVPPCLNEDIFCLGSHNAKAGDHETEEMKRPPYRWLLFAPQRSGTSMHVDPLLTHAWVGLVRGLKRWCLFPAGTPRQLLGCFVEVHGAYVDEAKSSGDSAADLADLAGLEGAAHDSVTKNPPKDQSTLPHMTAAEWFSTVYPRTQMESWPKKFLPVSILQRPGEVVYVPAGWPHIVLNLGARNLAVTHNFATSNGPYGAHTVDRLLACLADEAPEFFESVGPLIKSHDMSVPCPQIIGRKP